jgi:hypothetical protein
LQAFERRGPSILCIAVTLFFAGACLGRAQPFTFNDIQYWVGAGTNRAALAIDWSDGSTNPSALVWGFRWDGAATGRDMLTALVRADDRLYAKFNGSAGSEALVYGLGYDTNNNGQFSISDDTVFDSQTGIAYGSAPFFGANSSDSQDYYAEGWTFGFWHYGVASSDPYNGGTWLDSPSGMASRTLADGAWDSWTFTPTFNFAAFAQNPQAAAPPLLGDFNGDGRVDGTDYDVWKNTFGSTLQLAADANGNHIVDAADYTIWRDHFGQPVGSAVGASSAAEPPTLLLALCSLCALWPIRFFSKGRCLMKLQLWTCIALVAVVLVLDYSNRAAAQYAVQVVSYNQGTTPAFDFSSSMPYNLAATALGSPERFTGEGVFPGAVTPFNPPFLRDEIVSIGEGGQLTLRLSNYAIPQAGAPEIGIFSNPGLIDTNYPNGQVGPSASTFGADSAVVEVSGDGVSWTSLNSNAPEAFDIPTNGYTDRPDPYSAVAGSTPSDFQKPFAGSLNDFSGLKYYNAGGGDILGLLAGSGGGKWLDISGTGLSQVGFIRFSVADDGTSRKFNFELDAVSVSHAALGAATPEPATIELIAMALVTIGFFGSIRGSRQHL